MAATIEVVDVEVAAVTLPSLSDRVEMIDDWEDAVSKANELARRDRDYYDNHQWTREEIDALKERHQPVLTKNRIARKVNFILGEEIKRRINPVARPRTPQHEDSARSATEALRFVADEQRFDQARSMVLRNVLVEGIGGAVVEAEQVDGVWTHGLRAVEFDRLAYDPHSRATDFRDAKWLAVIQWMDLDDAVAEWPDAEDDLRGAVNRDSSGGGSQTDDRPRQWINKKRDRVKVVEMFYRVGDNWYRFCFTSSADVAEPDRTWLRDSHGRSHSPLVMISCYVDAEARRYGVVRSLISPQDEINKRSSKALHQLSVSGAIAERDAVRDPNEFLSELAKPDGFAEVEPGALVGGRLQLREGAQLSQGQMMLLAEAKADIDTIGPAASMVQESSGSVSGRAFLARQQAASQELGPVFDQLRSWSLRVFELDWMCIRQYWTDERWLRVTDDQEMTGYRFSAVNQRMARGQRMQELLGKGSQPQQALAAAAGDLAPIIERDAMLRVQQIQQQAQMAAQQGMQVPPPPQDLPIQVMLAHPLMREVITVNQIDQIMVDIVLDEAPDTAILAQEEFATLSEILPTVAQARPDVAPKLVSLMIRASSLPDKRELMKLLEAPPDQAQAQQQQQIQQQAQAMMQAQAQAAISVQQSQAQLNQAKAAVEAARVQTTQPLEASEIERNKAAAMLDAASAGAKSAGG